LSETKAILIAGWRAPLSTDQQQPPPRPLDSVKLNSGRIADRVTNTTFKVSLLEPFIIDNRLNQLPRYGRLPDRFAGSGLS
jgi:hypothetical protein